MRRSPDQLGFFQRLFLAILLSLLIWEWLKTLPSVTDTEAAVIWMFMVPVVGILALCLLLPWMWVRIPLSLLLVLLWFHHTQLGGPFLSLAWVKETWMRFRETFPSFDGLHWQRVDPAVRTGLFYLFLWIAVHWLYQEMIVRKRILFLLFLTLAHFSVLDTFFAFEGRLPVIKGMACGLAMLAIANLGKLQNRYRVRIPFRKKSLYLAVATLLILSAVITGCLSPKGLPVWPDPVSWFQTVKDYPDSGAGELFDFGMAKSGYGLDDSRLGGPFIQSDEPVLIARVTGEEYPEHYWRGESKEIYTGRGWEALQGETVELPAGGKIPFRLLDHPAGKQITEIVEMEKPVQSLFFTSGQPILFAGIRPNSAQRKGAGTILADPSHFRFRSVLPYKRYTASSVIPVFSEPELIELSERLKNDPNAYPEEIKERYLQLPAALPDRVKYLADKVAGEETNLYKKVKAVESFLRSGVFIYDTGDVPLPSENQDYVDQFLFESRRGYCDNFSTAMVVMLRTQGIPARWVKGYAFGEVQRGGEKEDGTEFSVTVREKNAHSWVEVYFPGVGWIPFEPTPGFFYPYEVTRADQEVSALPDQEIGQERLEQLLEEAKEEVGDTASDPMLTEQAEERSVPFGHWPVVLFSAAVLLIAAALLFILRGPLRFAIHLSRVRYGKGREMVLRAFEILLYRLEKSSFPRHSGQTLREYVSSLDLAEGTEELIELTKLFEQVRYGGKMPDWARQEFYTRWKEFLKRLRRR